MGKEELLKKLDELGIKYECVNHPPVYTIEEMEQLDSSIFKNAEICKNLFLRDQKGKRHFLIVICQDKQAKLEDVEKQIYSSRLSFGSAERLMANLGLEHGYVSPMGLVNDPDNKVEVFFDKDLKNKELIAVHPNTNEASLLMSFKELTKFIDAIKHDYDFIKI